MVKECPKPSADEVSDDKVHVVGGKADYRHILKYTGLFGGVQGFTILLSVVRNKCAALLIGPAGMGLIDIYNRMADFISNATNLGIPFSGIKYLSEVYGTGNAKKMEQAIGSIRLWCLLTALLGFLSCCICSPLASHYLFGDISHTLDFCALGLLVFLCALNGGEFAILKGIRRLSDILSASFYTAIGTLMVSVSFYYLWGMRGILPALLLGTLVQSILALYYTGRVYPWRMPVSWRSSLQSGYSFVRLGMVCVLAGVVTSGAEMLVRVYLSRYGSSWEDVGLYASGLVVCVTYSGLIFKAMDVDYFPRLASLPHSDGRGLRTMVNRQIDVCVLLMAPSLIFLLLIMPWLVRLLYSSRFMEVVPMVIGASFYTFSLAVSKPLEYIPLARGDSKTFLGVEILYNIFFVCSLIVGYSRWGLVGAGGGLSLANLTYGFTLYSVFRYRYQYGMERNTVRNILLQSFLLGCTLVLISCFSGLWKYGLSGGVLCLSIAYSYKKLEIPFSVLWRRR